MGYSYWWWGREVWHLHWDWRSGGDSDVSSWDLIGLRLLLMGLSVLKGAIGNVWSRLISNVVWRLVLGVVGDIVLGCVVLGPIVVLWAIVLGCARVVPWSVLMWWLAVLIARKKVV